MSGQVDIVIVNWNSGPLLARALVAAQNACVDRELLARVVVVDNASDDSSLDCAAAGLELEIIRNDENRGFGAACNQGAKAGHAPFILFHNPDVELRPGALEAAVAFLEAGKSQRIGITAVALLDAAGARTPSTSRFPTVAGLVGQAMGLDRLGFVPPVVDGMEVHRGTRDVEQVMGAFLMIRRDLFEQLGGFDERFFVYYDDVDLSLRVRQAGWRSVFLGEVAVFHEGQGTTRSVKDVRLFYLLRSRLLYSRKHFGLFGQGAVMLATLLIEPVARAGLLLARGAPVSDLCALGRGYMLLYRALPRLSQDARKSAPQLFSQPGDPLAKER